MHSVWSIITYCRSRCTDQGPVRGWRPLAAAGTLYWMGVPIPLWWGGRGKHCRCAERGRRRNSLASRLKVGDWLVNCVCEIRKPANIARKSSDICLHLTGEMWVGITLAVVIEVVPVPLRASAVAVYMFIISNIGGNVPLLVPVLKSAFQRLGHDPVFSLRGNTILIILNFSFNC